MLNAESSVRQSNIKSNDIVDMYKVTFPHVSSTKIHLSYIYIYTHKHIYTIHINTHTHTQVKWCRQHCTRSRSGIQQWKKWGKNKIKKNKSTARCMYVFMWVWVWHKLISSMACTLSLSYLGRKSNYDPLREHQNS